MSGEILINYGEAYSKFTELRNRVETELRETANDYRQANFAASQMYGSTNAHFAEAMAANHRKSQVTADTMTKLILFMDNSARQVEREEQSIARIFESSAMRMTRPIRTGVGL